jgi:chaperonin GroEL
MIADRPEPKSTAGAGMGGGMGGMGGMDGMM